MFEAGALSKSLDSARVCPLLFGVEPAEVVGPLVQFQASVFQKADVRVFINTVNSALGENSLEAPLLDSVFEKWWPELESNVRQIQQQPALAGVQKRSDRELLEELLSLIRTMSFPGGIAAGLHASAEPQLPHGGTKVVRLEYDCSRLPQDQINHIRGNAPRIVEGAMDILFGADVIVVYAKPEAVASIDTRFKNLMSPEHFAMFRTLGKPQAR
jgi:hypothetical protein